MTKILVKLLYKDDFDICSYNRKNDMMIFHDFYVIRCM